MAQFRYSRSHQGSHWQQSWAGDKSGQGTDIDTTAYHWGRLSTAHEAPSVADPGTHNMASVADPGTYNVDRAWGPKNNSWICGSIFLGGKHKGALPLPKRVEIVEQLLRNRVSKISMQRVDSITADAILYLFTLVNPARLRLELLGKSLQGIVSELEKTFKKEYNSEITQETIVEFICANIHAEQNILQEAVNMGFKPETGNHISRQSSESSRPAEKRQKIAEERANAHEAVRWAACLEAWSRTATDDCSEVLHDGFTGCASAAKSAASETSCGNATSNMAVVSSSFAAIAKRKNEIIAERKANQETKHPGREPEADHADKELGSPVSSPSEEE